MVVTRNHPNPLLRIVLLISPVAMGVACRCPIAELFPRSYLLLKGAVSCYGNCLPCGTLNSTKEENKGLAPLSQFVITLKGDLSFKASRGISRGFYCNRTIITLLPLPNAPVHISAQVLLLTAFFNELFEHKSVLQGLFAEEPDSLVHHFTAPWRVPIDIYTW